MSSPFVTITHDDPSFQKYLLGSFSKELRALPVESFRQHSSRERITFRLVPVEQIVRPSWRKIYLKACRPELLGLTLGPFAVTGIYLSKSFVPSFSSALIFLSALCGIFFVHVATFLFNDFRDHMRGVDLANRRRGSQVIQKGWASAKAVRGWAYLNLFCALVCGAPALMAHPQALGLIVLLAGVALFGLAWVTSQLARWGISDLMVFIGLGPLLTAASGVICLGFIPSSALMLGAAFGSLAVLTMQMRQMENLFRAGRDSFRTFLGGFEFDRAKALLLAQMLFVAALQIAIATQVFQRWVAVAGFAFALAPLTFAAARIRHAASPVSSDLVHLGRRAIVAQAALLAWWGAAVWI